MKCLKKDANDGIFLKEHRNCLCIKPKIKMPWRIYTETPVNNCRADYIITFLTEKYYTISQRKLFILKRCYESSTYRKNTRIGDTFSLERTKTRTPKKEFQCLHCAKSVAHIYPVN